MYIINNFYKLLQNTIVLLLEIKLTIVEPRLFVFHGTGQGTNNEKARINQTFISYICI